MKENTTKTIRKVAIACLISVGVMGAAFGGTWAYYSDTLSLTNPLRTSNTSVSMVEDFDPTEPFLPGESVKKVVSFQNDGEMDVFLRVQVPPVEWWQDNETGSKNKNLSTSRAIKNWSDAWTMVQEVINDKIYKYQVNTDSEEKLLLFEKKDENDENVVCTPEYWGETDEWSEAYQGADGIWYRYYKKVLKAKGDPGGGDKTNPILESVTLDPEVSNDIHETNYSEKYYNLRFDAQAILVEGDGPASPQSGAKTVWGMTVTGTDGALTWSPADGTGN